MAADSSSMRAQIIRYRFDAICTHACFESLLDVYEDRIRAEALERDRSAAGSSPARRTTISRPSPEPSPGEG